MLQANYIKPGHLYILLTRLKSPGVIPKKWIIKFEIKKSFAS